jgi:hypothetical protein
MVDAQQVMVNHPFYKIEDPKTHEYRANQHFS